MQRGQPGEDAPLDGAADAGDFFQLVDVALRFGGQPVELRDPLGDAHEHVFEVDLFLLEHLQAVV